MKSLGNSLLDTLKTTLITEIAEYIQHRYMTTYPIDDVIAHINSLKKTIEQVPEGIDLDYTVLIQNEKDDFEESETYWSLSLKKGDEKDLYSISFVPFNEVLRYPVIGYQENPEIIGDIIWDLTFDGWTQEQQNERIKEMNDRIK